MTIKDNVEVINDRSRTEWFLREAKRAFDEGDLSAGITHLGQGLFVASADGPPLDQALIGALVNRATTAGILATKTW